MCSLRTICNSNENLQNMRSAKFSFEWIRGDVNQIYLKRINTNEKFYKVSVWGPRKKTFVEVGKQSFGVTDGGT